VTRYPAPLPLLVEVRQASLFGGSATRVAFWWNGDVASGDGLVRPDAQPGRRGASFPVSIGGRLSLREPSAAWRASAVLRLAEPAATGWGARSVGALYLDHLRRAQSSGVSSCLPSGSELAPRATQPPFSQATTAVL
jgi:hypothetical protein